MNNYEITAVKAKSNFLNWDQNKIIQKFSLKADKEYIYINFCGNSYRINRKNATVERLQSGNTLYIDGFNELMSIFDVLCSSKDKLFLTGNWLSTQSLPHSAQSTPGSSLFFKDDIKKLDTCPNLQLVFNELGYMPFNIGDASCVFPVFDFLPAVFQFWHGDDEFPARINVLWDANTLDFLHWETLYYVVEHWMKELTSNLDNF